MAALAALALFASLPAARAVAQVPTGSVAGRVVTDSTGEPIEGAAVRLLGTPYATRTDAAGRFRFPTLPEGIYLLQARAFGHEPASASLTLDAGQALEVDVTLAATGYVLPEISVIGRAREGALISAKLAGFYQRQREYGGFGTFLTPDFIEKRNPAVATDILRNVPGVRLTCGGSVGSACVITVQRSAGTTFSNSGACPPLIYLDGIMIPGIVDRLDNVIPARNVQAVEVYRGTAGMPAEFNRQGAGCGVIAFWTGPRQ